MGFSYSHIKGFSGRKWFSF